jgi:hypothetical protein
VPGYLKEGAAMVSTCVVAILKDIVREDFLRSEEEKLNEGF